MQIEEGSDPEQCPECGSTAISGLMAAFYVPLNPDGSPAGDWNDWSGETELGVGRMCSKCEYEWESDR